MMCSWIKKFAACCLDFLRSALVIALTAGLTTFILSRGVEYLADEKITSGGTRVLLITAGALFGAATMFLAWIIIRAWEVPKPRAPQWLQRYLKRWQKPY